MTAPRMIVLLRVTHYQPTDPAEWLIELQAARQFVDGYFRFFDGQSMRCRPPTGNGHKWKCLIPSRFPPSSTDFYFNVGKAAMSTADLYVRNEPEPESGSRCTPIAF